LTQRKVLRASLALALVQAAACAGGVVSPMQKRDSGAGAGSSGSAGASAVGTGGDPTGAAGVGAAGPTGQAGVTGAAGATGAAGTTGLAGTTGSAGAGGTTGQAGSAGGTGGLPDPGTVGDGDFTFNGPYGLPPEATLMPGVTAGKLWTIQVSSKIFPGTTRDVQIYTPAAYVANSRVPFMVFQDGGAYLVNFKVTNVIDNLVAQKKLPLMISIFVNASGNRSAEYDALTDDYSQFVLTELLPAVEKLSVKLTTDPEGRAIGGHSSGGIAAFTVGWRHPDQFRRILTNSGSFVAILGGDMYPAMIRAQTPIKPLRVSLSTGTMDLSSPRWQQANVDMAAALKAMGYHYRFVLEHGGTHDQMYPATLITETLLWLWRGYPLN
jgi:enterochelin esterase-like enzyme